MIPVTTTSRRAALGAALATASLAAIAPALAQKNLGSYAGTIDVSESTPGLTYRARVKASMPVSGRSAAAIDAEFLAGEAPPATAMVTQWDTFHREKSADSGGQFNTRTCKLAAPVEIPMSATGVLNVDLKQKKHALSLALVSLGSVDFNCVHSRSGAYKHKAGITLVLGTGAPGMHYQTQLPFTDPARLAARHTLAPPAGAGERGPIVQEWDLKLAGS